VPVERGRLHAEPGGQRAHRQAVHADLVEQVQGGLHDGRLGELAAHDLTV
jgi:hypothetical protein